MTETRNGIRNLCETTCMFTIITYPFFNAFSFLMLIAEQARITSEPASFISILSSLIIYAHIVAMFMCALAMKLGHATAQVAVGHAAQLVLLIYYNVSAGSAGFRYAEGLKIRVLSRAVGSVAAYLTLAGLSGPYPRVLRAAIILFGVFATGCAYAIHYDPDYRLAFRLVYRMYNADIHSAIVIHMVAVVGFLVCALTFLNETITRHIAFVLMLLVLFINMAVDWQLDFWTRKQRADYWCALRIAADNFPVLAALLLIGTDTRNRTTHQINTTKSEDKEETEDTIPNENDS